MITFAEVSESGKISHLRVMVRGLQCPQNAARARNFKIFTFFAWPLCPNSLRQRLETDFILHPTGPASERPDAFEGDPLNFGPRPPWAAHPKKVFPHFLKNLSVRGQFFDCAIREPRGPSGIKFRQLYLGPFSQKKNSEISPKIVILSSYKNFPRAKKVVAMRVEKMHTLWSIIDPQEN